MKFTTEEIIYKNSILKDFLEEELDILQGIVDFYTIGIQGYYEYKNNILGDLYLLNEYKLIKKIEKLENCDIYFLINSF